MEFLSNSILQFYTQIEKVDFSKIEKTKHVKLISPHHLLTHTVVCVGRLEEICLYSTLYSTTFPFPSFNNNKTLFIFNFLSL